MLWYSFSSNVCGKERQIHHINFLLQSEFGADIVVQFDGGHNIAFYFGIGKLTACLSPLSEWN